MDKTAQTERNPEPQFEPDWVTPPGQTIRDYLDEQTMTQAELSERTGISKKTINLIIKGKAPLTQDTAFALEKAMGIPARFWINREKDYRERLARQEQAERYEQYQDWARSFPYPAMAKLGWVEPTKAIEEKVENLLSYFRVVSPDAWRRVWARPQAAFRRSQKYGKKTEVISAWLRRGEIEAERTQTSKFSEAAFTDALEEVRKLAIETEPDRFRPQMEGLCAEAGVVFMLVPEPPSMGVSGVTRWIGDRPVIQQCLRFRTNDHYWFTFFHEAKHVLQKKKTRIFIEADGLEEEDEKREEEANEFAADTLIPPDAYREYCQGSIRITRPSIRRFAESVGVHPGIVAGRLMREKLIEYSHPARTLRVKVEDVWG